MTYQAGSLVSLAIPEGLPDGMPAVFDDMSFALSLGLQNRTVWWLVHASKIDCIAAGRGAYDVFRVPKKSGGSRQIHAPRATLKRVQRVLLQVYFNKLPVGDWVGAYVPGRDMVYSVNKHTNKDVVVSLDLSNFFGSTKRTWVREWLEGLGYGMEVVVPMSGLITVPVRRRHGVTYVVPQGAPTSGAVTNHVASARLDAPLMAYLENAGLTDWDYTRYADDLTISYNGFLPKDEFDVFMEGVRQVVKDSGYYLNHKKTRVAVSRPAKSAPQRMLGMSIHKKPNVPREKKRLLRARVHHMVTQRHPCYDADNIFAASRQRSQALDKLFAELRYWVRISPQTIEPLLTQLEETFPNE